MFVPFAQRIGMPPFKLALDMRKSGGVTSWLCSFMPGMLVLRFSSIAQQHSLPALLSVREKRERLLQALRVHVLAGVAAL